MVNHQRAAARTTTLARDPARFDLGPDKAARGRSTDRHHAGASFRRPADGAFDRFLGLQDPGRCARVGPLQPPCGRRRHHGCRAGGSARSASTPGRDAVDRLRCTRASGENGRPLSQYAVKRSLSRAREAVLLRWLRADGRQAALRGLGQAYRSAAHEPANHVGPGSAILDVRRRGSDDAGTLLGGDAFAFHDDRAQARRSRGSQSFPPPSGHRRRIGRVRHRALQTVWGAACDRV